MTAFTCRAWLQVMDGFREMFWIPWGSVVVMTSYPVLRNAMQCMVLQTAQHIRMEMHWICLVIVPVEIERRIVYTAYTRIRFMIYIQLFNTWNARCKKITAGIKASPSIGSDRHGLTVAMFGPTRWVTFVTTFTLGQCDGFVSDTCNPYRGVKKIKFLGWLTSCGKCCI